MSIQDEIEKFGQNFKTLQGDLNTVTTILTKKLKQRLFEIRPLIEYFKDNKFLFTHPSLDSGVSTTIGVILGRNVKTLAEIYVYDGSSPVVYRVSLSDPNVIKEAQQITLDKFFEICDHDFALQGIEHIRSGLGRIESEIRDLIARRTNVLNKITKA